MDYSYLALLAAVLLVVFVLAWLVVRTHRRFGRGAAWLMIVLEGAAAGYAVHLFVKYMPGMAESWIGQQVILASVGIMLAIVIGGGLVMALGRRN